MYGNACVAAKETSHWHMAAKAPVMDRTRPGKISLDTIYRVSSPMTRVHCSICAVRDNGNIDAKRLTQGRPFPPNDQNSE
jgi:hypothetical protein